MNKELIFRILQNKILDLCIQHDCFEETYNKLNLDNKTSEGCKGQISGSISSYCAILSNYSINTYDSGLKELRDFLVINLPIDHYGVQYVSGIINSIEASRDYAKSKNEN